MKNLNETYMTQQELCDSFNIKRSTLYDRMRANGMTNFMDYRTSFMISWLEQELKDYPVRKYKERKHG